MKQKKKALRPNKASAAGDKSTVRALAKAFKLLETIAATDNDMTLSDISAMSGLDPGTTHRMLHTMTNLGYVARSDDRHFTLTLKVLDLGFRAIGHRDIGSLARPVLRTLVGEVNEAASLAVLQGSDILYVERVRAGIARLGVDIRVGTQTPAASSIMGWAILAFMPKEYLASLAAQQPSASGGLLALEQPVNLSRQLSAVKKNGYALSTGRISPSEAVLAVPILDADKYPVAAISVAAPSFRMNPEDLRVRALPLLLDAAKEIGKGLQAAGTTL
jgi:IclR family pca regulon transcriptional regulator